MDDAARRCRSRLHAAFRHRRRVGARRADVRLGAASRRGRRPRAVVFVDRVRPATTGGEESTHDPARARGVLDPAAAGSGGGSTAGAGASAGARRARTDAERRRVGGRRSPGDPHRDGGRRPLLPSLRPARGRDDARTGGVHRLRAAHRRRHRGADGAARPLGGVGSLRRRSPARRIRSIATSCRPTSSRSKGSSSVCSSSPSACL